MTNLKWNTPVTAILMTTMLSGCKAVDKIKDALDGEPQTSYCESLCDWAVACAEGESSLSTDEMMSECLSATRASDSRCADAEAGGMAVDESLILTECTNAVERMDCSGLTGTEAQVGSGRPPEVTCIAAYGGMEDVSGLDLSSPEAVIESFADISTYETYNEARNAVMKTGDELCDDVSHGFCDSLVGCVTDTTGTEDGDAEDLLMEQCLNAFDGFTSKCKEKGLYDQTLPLDLNLTRFMAEDCVAGLAEADACDVGSWPAECALAFTSVDGSDNFFDLVTNAASEFIGE
mgnify:CR=1 FL=1